MNLRTPCCRRLLCRAFGPLELWISSRSCSITSRMFCAYRSLCLFLAIMFQLDSSSKTSELATIIGRAAEMIRDVDRDDLALGCGVSAARLASRAIVAWF